MKTLQTPRNPAAFDKALLQFRMQSDELSQRITRLLGSVDEILISGKPVVDSLGLRSKHHPRSRFFEPVPQLDVFHTVNLKVLVKAAHVQKYVRRRGYVAGVVVGKIDRPLRRGVRIKNAVVSQISQERIGSIAPGHADGA